MGIVSKVDFIKVRQAKILIAYKWQRYSLEISKLATTE